MKTQSTSSITYLGLAIAFIGVPLVVFLFSLNAAVPYTDAFIVKKETLIFLTTGLLLLLVVKGEKMSLESIGLHNRRSVSYTHLTLPTICHG